MISISTCIIAKNEEKNIEKCLNSIRNISDEIILVDTGSTDNTVALAKMFNAKIIYSKFENDFAKVRNLALDNATKEFILYLDCDEELDKIDATKLRKVLEDNPGYEGYTLNLINIIDGQVGVKTPSLRIFRNRPEYRFKGRIHEIIQPQIEALKGKDCFYISDLKFYHYGYGSSVSDIDLKSKRNLEILNSYEEWEKDGFYYYNLANEYLRINKFDEAIEYYKKSLDYEDTTGYKVYIPIYMVNAFIDNNQLGNAIREGNEFLKIYPTNKDLYFLIGVCYSKLGMYKEFLECLLKYKEFSMNNYGYPEFNFHLINNIDALILDTKSKLGNN